MENTKQTQITAVDFIALKDLTAKQVSQFIRIPVRLKRTVYTSSISTSITLVINPTQLLIPIVSSETINGQSRRLRYFKPDRFIALIHALNLKQKDERGLDKNEWVYYPAIRFVKGKTKNNDEYHMIEVIFKQYKYETVFLTNDQVTILNNLSEDKQLFDSNNKPYQIKWIDRPDTLAELGEDLFEF